MKWMSMWIALWAGMSLCGFASRAAADQGYVQPAPQKSEIAPGIYLFQTAPYGDVGLDGNAVAVTSSDGVRWVPDANNPLLEPQPGVGGYSVYQATMGTLSATDGVPSPITCTGW